MGPQLMSGHELLPDQQLWSANGTFQLILQSDGNIITVGPPICVTRDDCDEIIAGIDASFTEVAAEMGSN